VRTVRCRIVPVALTAALLFPAVGLAQRRVIAPPGSKPAATEEKKAEPAKPPEARPEEPKKPAAANPPDAGAPPAAQPAPAAKEQPKKEATSAPESDSPRTPVAKEPKKEAAPAPTPVLVPKDEQDAPKKDVKSSATASKAEEAVYRRKIDKMSVTLRVRPARPLPSRTTTLLFEIVKLLAVPDPALGDRVPLENALLFVTVGKDGTKTPARYRLHPLADAGVYGVHFTASEAGPYRLALEQRLVNAEIGDKALTTDFVLGIGQDTPMEAASEDESAIKAGRGRTAIKASDGLSQEGAATVMRALGDQWVELADSLEDPAAKGDKVAAARAIAEASSKLAGQVPSALTSSRREFDTLAGDLAASLKELPAAVGAGAAQGRAQMVKIDAEQCSRCHVKFRFQLAEDVSGWPKFTPKAPKEKESGPRKPLQR
jgi:hypothetical protein